jgi:hypothetical protein
MELPLNFNEYANSFRPPFRGAAARWGIFASDRRNRMEEYAQIAEAIDCAAFKTARSLERNLRRERDLEH